ALGAEVSRVILRQALLVFGLGLSIVEAAPFGLF
ncbi:hypothetical protein PSYJA_47148, partial [Pseudomonas syringae pv. japonica str. M301072]